MKLTGRPEEITHLHRSFVFRKTGEVAEVEQQRGEVGHDQHGRIGHMPDRRSLGPRAQLQRQARSTGLRHDPDRERKHHDVDHGSAEIDELADRLHAVEEDQKLEQPHEQETGPAQRREACKAGMRPRFRARVERQHQRLDGLGGKVGLHAVPDDADDAAQAGGNVGAHHAERHPRHDWKRRAVFQRRASDQIHQEVDDGYAHHHRQQHLPPGQTEKEKTRREGIAADRMHIRHPHREDAEDTPGASRRRNRRQIMIVELGVGIGHGNDGRGARVT